VEDHLRTCISCKRRLAEFEAIISAARNLAPLTVSVGFQYRVLRAVQSRQISHEVLSDLRYKMTLAGVAFVVTSAAIFFMVGPPGSRTPSFTGSPDSSNLASPDFYTHPETKVSSFPVPESSNVGQYTAQDQLAPTDSVRPNEFILPNVQKVNENIDSRF